MIVAEKLLAPVSQNDSAPDVFEHSVVLHEVAWETYLSLRLEEDNNHLNMTYDRGVLEIISPSRKHARVSGVIAWMICEWALARQVKIELGGDTTFSRKELERGLEADHCYWISRYSAVHGKDEIDLTVDPPPDLALEIEVSRSAVPKLPIYESLRVPEVWRWHKGALTVLALNAESKYVQQTDSIALPGFPFWLVEDLLTRREHEDDSALMLQFRQAIADLPN